MFAYVFVCFGSLLALFTCSEIDGPAGCNRKVRAVKQLSLWKLPQIFMVALKRIEWLSNFQARKLDCLVDMPTEGLDFTHLVAPEAPQKVQLVYDVVAVIDHVGMRADEGHYTATCRRPDGWFHFDDSIASPLPPDVPIVGRQNYILFLERRDAPRDPTSIPQQRVSQPHAWPHVIDVDWSFLAGSDGLATQT